MKITHNSFLQFPIIRIMAGLLWCFGLTYIIKRFVAEPALYAIFNRSVLADTLKHCIFFATLLTSYYLFSKYYERSSMQELSTQNIITHFLAGTIAGFSLISFSILLLYLFGYYHVDHISSCTYSMRLFTLLLTAALVEDLLTRGLIIRILETWLGTWLTILIGMLLELFHIFNPNSSPAAVVMYLGWGFTMTALYVYSKTIWLPFFFHVAWNFAQPFYGSNLTGLDDMGKIMHARFSGPAILTGGQTGIEASVFTIVSLYLTGAAVLYLAAKKNKIVYRRRRSLPKQ